MKFLVLPGDGIGPEVSEPTKQILAASGAEITWIERFAGQAALDRGDDSVLPEATLDAFCTVIEEVSHFLFLAFCVRSERSVTRLELELR